MAYLDNSVITVDAILTKKGREKLSQGAMLQISQFSVSDSEIDYSLYSPGHPLGSNFAGAIIENMPIVEASPDETQEMRYRLVTLPRGTKQIPVIALGFSNITLTAGQANAVPIRPTTAQGLNGAGFGYTAILYNSDAAILVGTGLPANFNATAPAFLGDSATANAIVAQGLDFTLTPKDVATQITTQLTIVGNQTGATITIPVVIKPRPSTT